ncbi:MAG TPA: glycine betaine ABC transporter substrate-binding protein [Candidatus Dormibacteraeota bacterium]|jgi:osmoprotectant transport system substrate-binding protein|nr:glycine betaine ABC transporter substrate-binding protein [Candidatus Dormibacteraeota bacterium]
MLTLSMLGTLALTACGSTPAPTTSSGGTAACPASGTASSRGSGALKIGSKAFAEEELLAEMAKLVLEKHGYTVDFSFKAKDPALGQALEQGTIDLYWQYTGTELQGPLAVDKPPTDLDAAFTLARTKDEARGICWTAKANFDDTNGLAIKASDKSRYGATLSAFSSYLKSYPNTVVCINSEFRTRADGIPGLQTAYGNFDVPGLKDIGASTAEALIASGQCAAGEVFTTDSAIAANNLYVLQDDKKVFPPDNVGLLVRSSVLKAHPEIGAIMQPVADKLTTDVMTGLNKKVEIDGLKVEDVARDFLTTNGLLN